MKPILLGMARGDGSEGPALLPSERGSASSADRLLRISGMGRNEFIKKFERKNIIENEEWSEEKARIQGYRLRKELKGKVLVLGKQTWHALWLPSKAAFFSKINVDETEFTLLPHPSGRNQALNDAKIRARMGRVLRGEE